ncbi:MAG: transposase, partial [Planctomycetaceae bacterium]|nr:transposase [Planctomycetaceae bacterium]
MPGLRSPLDVKTSYRSRKLGSLLYQSSNSCQRKKLPRIARMSFLLITGETIIQTTFNQMKIQTQPQTRSLTSVLGIDVSKETLDCVHLPSGEHFQAQNHKTGYKQIAAFAKKHQVQLAVCEYTGHYEQKLLIALADANIEVAAVNPAHVRFYAKSKGIRHKTDKVDAKIIAEFALERQPEPTKQQTENEIALKEFVALR